MKKLKSKSLAVPVTDDARIESLYSRIFSYIHKARQRVERSINSEMVKTYWLIGKEIIEEEQRGKKRADYGTFLLRKLSIKLEKEFGSGFGITTLKNIRQFYLIYRNIGLVQKGYTLCSQSGIPKFSAQLSWGHYRQIMRIARYDARKFYDSRGD